MSHKKFKVSHNNYGCNWLTYTIYSPNNVSELILVLTSHETVMSVANSRISFSNHTKALLQQFYHTSRIEPMLYSNILVYAKISILPCPIGFELTTKSPFKCDCNQLLQQMPGVHCHIWPQWAGVGRYDTE